MLYREISAVCSEIQTKHINTLCGQNVEFVNVKPGGTQSNHWALKGLLLVSYFVGKEFVFVSFFHDTLFRFICALTVNCMDALHWSPDKLTAWKCWGTVLSTSQSL
jgi:hypothetical protein